MNKDFTHLKIHLMMNGISQTQIANDTGLHKNTISKLTRTGEGTKSVKELVRLYLGMDKDEFYALLS
jgi:transcriptional regulator with XRE-family HTH domain